MDTNKMRDISRDQFEAWHRSVVEGEPPHEKYNNGDYRNQHVQRYWLGWQASREAVAVDVGDMEWVHIDEIIASIEAHGLKVAP